MSQPPPPGPVGPTSWPPPAPRLVLPPPAWMVAGNRTYATWGDRVLAFLLDQVFSFVVVVGALVVGAVPILVVLGTGRDVGGWFVFAIVVAATLVYAVAIGATYWNIGWRQGRTGQSLGKQAMGIEVVWEHDGTHIMAGSGLLRALVAGIVSGSLLVGYLWPLWDDRNRTWHDLVLKTLVVDRVRVAATPPTAPPPTAPPPTATYVGGPGPGGTYPPSP